MLPFLLEAAKAALTAAPVDKRNFMLGAVGIRKDGAIVSAKNGAVISSTYEDYRIISDAHAEIRCLRKLGKGGILYVSRVLKKDGSLAMASPCNGCRLRIRAAKVQRVYYTVNDRQYGIWYVDMDRDLIYTIR